MNIDYLRYFLDVTDKQSITQAAKLNFISPQGMSRAMSELEKELDCKLLERYPNKLMLSRAGLNLIPDASDVVKSYMAFKAHALELSRQEKGKAGTSAIELLCQRIGSLCFFPPAAMKLVTSKNSRLVYREMDNALTLQALQDALGENAAPDFAQVGILSIFDSDDPAQYQDIHRLEELGYSYRPYLTTYDMVLVSKESRLAAKDQLSHEDVLSYPLASTDSSLYDRLVARFGAECITVTTGEFEFRRKLVQNDSAVTFLPAIATLTIEDDGLTMLKKFDDTYHVQIGFLGLKETLESSIFRNFVKQLDDFYQPKVSQGLFTLE